ncbi:hypothetical protein T492DRAFT_1025470 [Pavlovales sp. CCMP2436]|nr:hypothetical protein T492DRAFT_1025470 [Pavlovales sp. CCMP2436]
MAAGRRALGIELAIVSKGIPGRATLDGRTDPETDASTVVVPYPCAEPLEGIALNLSAHGSGELWGLPREQVEVREMRCGYAMLARAWKQAASRPAQFGEMLESPGLFGGKRLVALLGTGHQPHSHAHDAAMQQVSQQLAYAAPLLREAERFIGERLAPLVHSAHEEGGHQSPALPAAGGGYVAVHWRHGDYVPYGHATEVQVLAGKVAEALARLDGCQACPVFLATNCKEQQPLNELRELLYPAPVLVYAPPDGPAGEAFRSEGHRLMVDQAIAARGSVFVRSPRSAVSTFIDVERKRLGLDSPAMSING